MRVHLQPAVPYQHSLRWELHHRYYQSRGVNAWVMPEIPYNVTSNPQQARQMARLAQAALQAADGPFRILEVGAGLGVFALNFLNAFETLCHESRTDFSRIEYWLTDYAPATLTALAAHPAFGASIEQGRLRLAVLDGRRPEQGRGLDGSQLDFETGSFSLIFGSYYLCTLPSAQLYVSDGGCYELQTELWGWLSGSPGQPAKVQSRAEVLHELARELAGIGLAGRVPAAVEPRLQHARALLIEAMQRPEAAQNWQPHYDLRAFIANSLVKAAAEADQAPDPGLRTLIEQTLVGPLLARLHFDQQQLEDVTSLKPIELQSYCESAQDQASLEALVAGLPAASLSYSPQALASIQALLPLLDPAGALLLTDKGYADQSELAGLHPPGTSIHGNSLAAMVNFPLLARQLEDRGHACLRTQEPEAMVQTLLVSPGPELPAQLELAFAAEFLQRNDNTLSQQLMDAGSQFAAQQQFQQALRCYLQAWRIRPTDFFVLMNIINSYRHLSSFARVQAYLELPHDGYFHEAFFARMKADVYFMLGQYARSLANYELALQAAPDDGLLNYYTALCLAALARLPEARQHLEHAGQLLPEHAGIAAALQELQTSQTLAQALQAASPRLNPFEAQFRRMLSLSR